ncbi:nucleoid occlusion factor SlmA [Pigmentiphaga litoralis]|uniref:TetR/AcrR family transcriptional regulator n=1 Tax=Pigmentiphaga litoralis TaxID=516702 RepID=A0A7Y9IRT2_9BURK|nr:nucleoid occlusion factor SlmA [Pigmentiphaga litoralis]NYE24746.1 TetR/AcrR family transcriptional regulator [Pigmentiphaga litoralis]NYE81640.1 TetR/AcrR family transcriptional regulator [Pigmentiphaga litoralis]
MAAIKSGERKTQILQMLAEMLEHPKGERITTAALAARLQVSEAALYRHFASKAQMFEGLIEFIETSIFGLINQIADSEASGIAQSRKVISLLLSFAERNKGLTRVLVGDALVIEDERLQERMNQFVDRIEASLRQGLRNALSLGELPPADDIHARASLILHFILGRWQRYAKTGWKKSPTEFLDSQMVLMLRA